MKPFSAHVAVTGLNATDNPGPGVAVARALRQDSSFNGKIIGLAYDVMDPGIYHSGLFDACFLIPYPSAGREALFERLAYIQQQVGIDVLIPNLDSELPALLGQESRLEALGIRTFLPTREAYDRRTKARLDELREQHGVAVPQSQTLTDVTPLYTMAGSLHFPLAVKGVFYGAEICHSLDEAVAAFYKAAATWGLPIIVQEFVPGEEFNVCAVGDGTGALVGAVAMKKLVLTDKGKGWAGVTIQDPRLTQLAAQVVAALKWRGPCEIEAKLHPQKGYQLLEVNPRFPAWCYLTAGAGQNQISAVARLAAGESLAPLPAARVGTTFIRISLDQIVELSQLEAISTRGEILPEALLETA
ncbi:MAG TPA: ATP-grasp domain-containing protein [Myxococcota bacterium]|nr:ATP-grasp domain-containing protein [Myxococcota bacterium]HND32069.1 ATP-grasp domain-containing protein [Myxococcota bacterium]